MCRLHLPLPYSLRMVCLYVVCPTAHVLLQHDVPTVAGHFFSIAAAPATVLRRARTALSRGASAEDASSHPKRPFRVLCASGSLKPATMTLLISPPGHGKTALLRALSGRGPGPTGGRVAWAGRTATELASDGVSLRHLAAYVDQIDCHLPLLTVRETVQFAWENATPDPARLATAAADPTSSPPAAATATAPATATAAAAFAAACADCPAQVLSALSLTGCADTAVGDALARGASGGERKRVSIAEALVSNARVLCLDEPSTGLDASVTFDAVSCIKALTEVERRTTLLSLLQPTPEVFRLFDEVRAYPRTIHGHRTDTIDGQPGTGDLRSPRCVGQHTRPSAACVLTPNAHGCLCLNIPLGDSP